MLTLAGHLFGCLFWGLVIALILTAICFFIAKGVTNKTPNPVVAAILLLLLAYQSILAVGSLYARSYVEDVRSLVENVADSVSGLSSSEATEAVAENFPAIPEKILENMASASETAGSVKNLADSMAASLKKSLTSYLWERVAWGVGFMVVGIFALVKIPASGGRGKRRGGGYGSTPSRDRYADLDY